MLAAEPGGEAPAVACGFLLLKRKEGIDEQGQVRDERNIAPWRASCVVETLKYSANRPGWWQLVMRAKVDVPTVDP